MNKKNLILFLIAMIVTGSATAQWEWIGTPTYNNPYYDCDYPSYGGCIVSGTDIYWTMTASCASPGMGQFVDLEIYKSENYGLNWNEVFSSQLGYSGSIIDLDFIAPSFGYMEIMLDYQYQLYRTNSSLNSVQECINPVPEKILDITMFNFEDVFAINESGGILHLENYTMVLINQLPVSLTENSVKPCLTYTNNHTLFLACKSYTDNLYENDLIFKSVDEGYTWDTCFVSNMDFINDLKFSNDSLGFAIGGYGLILKTTDAGASWEHIDIEYYTGLLSIDFMNDQQWIIGGFSGLILHTDDQGETWSQLESETDLKIKKICFPDKDELIMAITGGNGLRKSSLDLLTVIPKNNISYNIQIVPNPVNKYIEVKYSGLERSSLISIFGLEGEIVFTQKVLNKKLRIDVSSLPQGLYFLKVMNEKGTNVGKFVKK